MNCRLPQGLEVDSQKMGNQFNHLFAFGTCQRAGKIEMSQQTAIP